MDENNDGTISFHEFISTLKAQTTIDIDLSDIDSHPVDDGNRDNESTESPANMLPAPPQTGGS